jgi:hypothetical protein
MAHLGLGGEQEHLFMPGARFKVTQNSPASGTHTKRMIRMYEVTK